MTVGDKDCCSRPYCGHGEVYHSLRQGRHMGPCDLCSSSRGRYGCKRFAPPLEVGGALILIGKKFWYNFEGDAAFPKDPKGWIECKFVDDEYGSIIVKPKGHEKFCLSRRGVAERGAVVKPEEAVA